MKDHRYIDITLALGPGLPTWPGHPPFELELLRSIASGASSNVSRLSMSVHGGTHVDAPRHFFDDGAGADSLRLESMLGRAYVVYLPKVDRVTSAELERARIPSRTRRLLIRTRNSEFWSAGRGNLPRGLRRAGCQRRAMDRRAPHAARGCGLPLGGAMERGPADA